MHTGRGEKSSIKQERIRKKGNWQFEEIKAGLQQVLKKQCSLRRAAELYNIPKTTLKRRIDEIRNGNEVDLCPQLGSFKPTFNFNLENQLVLYMKDLDSKFMPFSKQEFLKFSYDLAEHLKIPHQFNKEKQIAGNKFYYNFVKKHPELVFRRPETVTMNKVGGFNKNEVERFFKKYIELVNVYNIKPERIYNCGETGICANVNLLLSINAAGDTFVPPLFVFSNKRVIDTTFTKDAPPGSIFVSEDTDLISTKSFMKWLEMFVNKTKPTKELPILLLLNCNASYKDLDILLYTKEHNVHMLSTPPHTTHILQPLDKTIMKSFKTAFTQACYNWMCKHNPMKISDNDISSLVAEAFSAICKMELAQTAFRCTGLWPINKNILIDNNICVPNETSHTVSNSVQTIDSELNMSEAIECLELVYD